MFQLIMFNKIIGILQKKKLVYKPGVNKESEMLINI